MDQERADELLPGFRVAAVGQDGESFILSDGQNARVVTRGDLLPARPFHHALAHGVWRVPEPGDPSLLDVLRTVERIIPPAEDAVDPEPRETDPFGPAPVTDALEALTRPE